VGHSTAVHGRAGAGAVGNRQVGPPAAAATTEAGRAGATPRDGAAGARDGAGGSVPPGGSTAEEEDQDQSLPHRQSANNRSQGRIRTPAAGDADGRSPQDMPLTPTPGADASAMTTPPDRRQLSSAKRRASAHRLHSQQHHHQEGAEQQQQEEEGGGELQQQMQAGGRGGATRPHAMVLPAAGPGAGVDPFQQYAALPKSPQQGTREVRSHQLRGDEHGRSERGQDLTHYPSPSPRSDSMRSHSSSPVTSTPSLSPTSSAELDIEVAEHQVVQQQGGHTVVTSQQYR
jgi:hypothetical protein